MHTILFLFLFFSAASTLAMKNRDLPVIPLASDISGQSDKSRRVDLYLNLIDNVQKIPQEIEEEIKHSMMLRMKFKPVLEAPLYYKIEGCMLTKDEKEYINPVKELFRKRYYCGPNKHNICLNGVMIYEVESSKKKIPYEIKKRVMQYPFEVSDHLSCLHPTQNLFALKAKGIDNSMELNLVSIYELIDVRKIFFKCKQGESRGTVLNPKLNHVRAMVFGPENSLIIAAAGASADKEHLYLYDKSKKDLELLCEVPSIVVRLEYLPKYEHLIFIKTLFFSDRSRYFLYDLVHRKLHKILDMEESEVTTDLSALRMQPKYSSMPVNDFIKIIAFEEPIRATLSEFLLTCAARKWFDTTAKNYEQGKRIIQILKDPNIIRDKYWLVWKTGPLFKNMHLMVQKLQKDQRR